MARFIPRQVVRPWSLPLLKRIPTFRPASDDGVEVLTLPSGPGVRLYRPTEATGETPALLWIHGGGYVVGSPEQDDALCRRYVERLGFAVAAVRYRLAPQHPYPAPLEDCYSALTWLAGVPGVDAKRIAIGGVSAGGGLAAALAFLTRDRAEVTPALQLLSAPMLDDRTVDPDLDRREFRLWNTASNRIGWTSYLGRADASVAVPARREDLAGLPATWIGVGTLDLFHAEGLAYAKRLTEAGVPCHVYEAPGAFHGFDSFAPGTSVATAYFESKCAALCGAMASAG